MSKFLALVIICLLLYSCKIKKYEFDFAADVNCVIIEVCPSGK